MTTNEEPSEDVLRSKYPQLAKKGGANQLLQKRLCKGHKYFDSGDYNVAKAQNQKTTNVLPTQKEEVASYESTGDTIATPETVSAVRKKSLQIHQPMLPSICLGHTEAPIIEQESEKY